MKPPAIRPRPDQISELSRGLRLPLPELQSDHLEIIAEGLRRAFDDISNQWPLVAASGSEAEITALMESRLNSLIEQDPLWGQLVLNVARGKESLSFDGSHLEKRPDLSIFLTSRNRGFPLITEAKILDGKAGKTEHLYCDKGIRRFLEGEYAWGNSEAFMMAYVRDGSSIHQTCTLSFEPDLQRLCRLFGGGTSYAEGKYFNRSGALQARADVCIYPSGAAGKHTRANLSLAFVALVSIDVRQTARHFHLLLAA